MWLLHGIEESTVNAAGAAAITWISKELPGLLPFRGGKMVSFDLGCRLHRSEAEREGTTKSALEFRIYAAKEGA